MRHWENRCNLVCGSVILVNISSYLVLYTAVVPVMFLVLVFYGIIGGGGYNISLFISLHPQPQATLQNARAGRDP